MLEASATELSLREVCREALLGPNCARLNTSTVPADVKRGAAEELAISEAMLLPKSWNHLEAGVLYTLALPALAFAEEGVTGGILGPGASHVVFAECRHMRYSDSRRGPPRRVPKWQASARALLPVSRSSSSRSEGSGRAET
jgi:hypothetical protein